PSSVVTKTCFDGAPEKPPTVTYALRPSAETARTRVTTPPVRPALLSANVAPPSEENSTEPFVVPIHTAPVESPTVSIERMRLVVTLSGERRVQQGSEHGSSPGTSRILPKHVFAHTLCAPKRTTFGAEGAATAGG